MTAEETALNFPFETNRFTEERIILHKFAHEMSHFLGEDLADQIEAGETVSPVLKQYEAFTRSFANFRRDPSNRGMTSHAGDERYMQKGSEIQAVEDMTDLLAFYIEDPQYLERYLQFLSNPQYSQEREKLKLVTLQPQVATLIYKNISKVVDGLLTTSEIK